MDKKRFEGYEKDMKHWTNRSDILLFELYKEQVKTNELLAELIKKKVK